MRSLPSQNDMFLKSFSNFKRRTTCSLSFQDLWIFWHLWCLVILKRPPHKSASSFLRSRDAIARSAEAATGRQLRSDQELACSFRKIVVIFHSPAGSSWPRESDVQYGNVLDNFFNWRHSWREKTVELSSKHGSGSYLCLHVKIDARGAERNALYSN
jgi:hypothetical protein